MNVYYLDDRGFKHVRNTGAYKLNLLDSLTSLIMQQL